MIQWLSLVLILLHLSACAGSPPLADPSGPLRPLNVGRWTPTEDDLRGPRPPLTPISSPSLSSEVGR